MPLHGCPMTPLRWQRFWKRERAVLLSKLQFSALRNQFIRFNYKRGEFSSEHPVARRVTEWGPSVTISTDWLKTCLCVHRKSEKRWIFRQLLGIAGAYVTRVVNTKPYRRNGVRRGERDGEQLIIFWVAGTCPPKIWNEGRMSSSAHLNNFYVHASKQTVQPQVCSRIAVSFTVWLGHYSNMSEMQQK